MPGKDALGDRMKVFYEDAYRIKLPRRIPVILRADGKAFHTYTRGLERPYSQSFMDAMDKVALEMCKQIQGAQLAYVQSDEISVLIRNDMTPKTGAWMENNLQKIVSVGASIAGTTMTVRCSARSSQLPSMVVRSCCPKARSRTTSCGANRMRRGMPFRCSHRPISRKSDSTAQTSR
jgi:tRNA(His) 5'-end guanylyltransferase